MMRKGLQITLCLALIVQASLAVAQQATNRPTNSPTRPIDKMGPSNDFPPMVRPDQFGRQAPVAAQVEQGRRQIQQSATSRLPADQRTVTLTDQVNYDPNVRQVSYTQDGVPVPSILGNQPTPPTQTAKTPEGQSPRVSGEPIPRLPTATKQEMVPGAMKQAPIEEAQVAQIPNGDVTPNETGPSATSGGASIDQQAMPAHGGSFANPMRSPGALTESIRTARAPTVTDSPIDAIAAKQEAESAALPSKSPEMPARTETERMAQNFRTVDLSSNSGSQIQTEGPKLRVIANGPSSIGIGKSARYEIVVHNDDRTTANDVIVGVDLPGWIDVKNINTTQGSRELTDGSEESRLIWNVNQIAAGTTEKLIIDVVPRQAKMFDLNVEWTVMPIHGTASVQVTEPRLDIEISGPNEVHFGDNALYSVTVSNPGTGVAENVNVMLPEALGGERATLGHIQPGRKKQIQVELVARQSGNIELSTIATADGELRQADSRNVIVRRGELDVQIGGPQMKYAGSVATYQVVVANTGDAIAQDVVAAIALPGGVEYLSGVEAVEKVQGGMRWKVGTLSPGTERTFHINCQLNQAGQMNLEVASRAKGDLATTENITTTVEAIADLILSVEDPKGPLPTGQDVVYQIKIKNRGSKVARGVELVMQFSEGIEPTSAQGHQFELLTGQVLFSPIEQIDPGQEITLKVIAVATQEGKHVYRAQLLCEESDAREVTEGTTKFYVGNGGTGSQLRTGRSTDNGGIFRK